VYTKDLERIIDEIKDKKLSGASSTHHSQIDGLSNIVAQRYGLADKNNANDLMTF
jgi:hypothetical protein